MKAGEDGYRPTPRTISTPAERLLNRKNDRIGNCLRGQPRCLPSREKKR